MASKPVESDASKQKLQSHSQSQPPRASVVQKQMHPKIQAPVEDRVEIAPFVGDTPPASDSGAQAAVDARIASLRKAMAAYKAKEDEQEVTPKADYVVPFYKGTPQELPQASHGTNSVVSSSVPASVQVQEPALDSAPIAPPLTVAKPVRRGLSQDLKRELAMMAMQDKQPRSSFEMPGIRNPAEEAALLKMPLGPAPELNSHDVDIVEAATVVSDSETAPRKALASGGDSQHLQPARRKMPQDVVNSFPDLVSPRRLMMHHAPNMAKVRAAQLTKKNQVE